MTRLVLDRFRGHILGAGSASGLRLVIGDWTASPLGAFTDVMVATAEDRRVLLAPSAAAAEYVAATYSFDEITEVPVTVRRTGTGTGSRWEVHAGPLAWRFTVGSRAPLGHVLRCVPASVGRTLTLAHLTDAVARRLMPGVRTLGSAGNGRLEWYAATDLHHLTASTARWDGTDLGALTAMSPPPDFGFGSTPRRPSLTALTTTVRLPPGADA